MFRNPRAKIGGLVLAALTGLSVIPHRAAAYPIDCAILLCLAGGWPASADCAHARAVFIRRITPYPIEPPLQIWRCPMGASYSLDGEVPRARLYKVLEQERAEPQPQTEIPPVQASDGARGSVADEEREKAKLIRQTLTRITGKFRKGDSSTSSTWDGASLAASSGSADINISDAAFDFVRSIRVFQIEASRRMIGSDGGNCTVRDNSRIGTYGPQGGFSGVAVRWVMHLRPSGSRGLEATAHPMMCAPCSWIGEITKATMVLRGWIISRSTARIRHWPGSAQSASGPCKETTPTCDLLHRLTLGQRAQ